MEHDTQRTRVTVLALLPFVISCSSTCRSLNSEPPSESAAEEAAFKADCLVAVRDNKGNTALRPTCKERIEYNIFKVAAVSTVIVEATRYDRTRDEMTISQASGAIIDDCGTIITANHIVERNEYLTVKFREYNGKTKGFVDGRQIPVNVAAHDDALDVALIVPRYPPNLPLPPPLPVLTEPPIERGASVLFTGRSTPYSIGVVSTSTVVDSKPRIVANLDAYYGDSGGPLLDLYGRVVGIITEVNVSLSLSFYRPIGPALQALHYDPKSCHR